MPARNVDVALEWNTPPTFEVTVNGAPYFTYRAGEIVTLTAIEGNGFTVRSWTAAGVSITNANRNNATFVMPARNVDVTLEWSAPPPRHTPTPSPSGSMVTPSPSPINTPPPLASSETVAERKYNEAIEFMRAAGHPVNNINTNMRNIILRGIENARNTAHSPSDAGLVTISHGWYVNLNMTASVLTWRLEVVDRTFGTVFFVGNNVYYLDQSLGVFPTSATIDRLTNAATAQFGALGRHTAFSTNWQVFYAPNNQRVIGQAIQVSDSNGTLHILLRCEATSNIWVVPY